MITSVKDDVFVTPPPMAVTVMGYEPATAELLATIFILVEHVGVHDESEKVAVTPDGTPVAEKVTD